MTVQDATLADLVEALDQAERTYRQARERDRELYDAWLAARRATDLAGAAVDEAREAYYVGRVNPRGAR
jgi:ABC-type transporter Mla subunit MlaD